MEVVLKCKDVKCAITDIDTALFRSPSRPEGQILALTICYDKILTIAASSKKCMDYTSQNKGYRTLPLSPIKLSDFFQVKQQTNKKNNSKKKN